jgi:hypothetical protein
MTKFLWVPSASIGLQRFNPDSPSEKTGRALLSSSPLPECVAPLRRHTVQESGSGLAILFPGSLHWQCSCLLLLVQDQEIYACLIQKEIYDSEIAERK